MRNEMIQFVIVSLGLVVFPGAQSADPWRWRTWGTRDLDYFTSAGYSNTHKKEMYICRWKDTNGYNVGGIYYGAVSWNEGGMCCGTSGDGHSAFTNNKEVVEILKYSPLDGSWQRAVSPEVVESLRPYLISGGKDWQNGTMEQYICRFIHQDPETQATLTVLGIYVTSGPLLCSGGWLDKTSAVHVVKSETMELLTSNMYTEVRHALDEDD